MALSTVSQIVVSGSVPQAMQLFPRQSHVCFQGSGNWGSKDLSFQWWFSASSLVQRKFLRIENHCFVFIYILHMECRGLYIVVYCLWCLSMHIFSVCFDVCALLCNKVPWSTLCIYLFSLMWENGHDLFCKCSESLSTTAQPLSPCYSTVCVFISNDIQVGRKSWWHFYIWSTVGAESD